MFPAGELPPRKFESVDKRNGAINSGHVAAAECHQRNCRDGFHGNQRTCLSGSFHDMLPSMHEIHSEAALYGAGRAQRAPVHHLTHSCSGQQSELFCDHDDHQGMSNKRFYHGATGSSTTISNHIGHHHNVCDRGCCGSEALHRERSGLANCSVDKTRPTSRSSLFVDSLEFHRNAAAVGSMSHCPSTPREVETRSSSLHTGSMANSGFPKQTNGANNQVMLYGWFLMNPHRENYNNDPPPRFSVAIGGYRCPKMEEQDFFATATVVERLERWKLRTSDGLEVGLMGMINIEKSVANGFSPSGSSPGVQSLSASPTDPAGATGVIRSKIKECLGAPTTLPLEANPVQSILKSSLFTADGETRMATLHKCTTPSHDGSLSDGDSIPQSHLGHEQVDAAKDDDHTCGEADFASHKVASTSDEPSSCCRDCSPSEPEGVVARDPCEAPETSSQTQIPTKFCPSDTNVALGEDEGEVSPGPSSIAKENMADEVHFQVSNGGAAICDSEKDDAVELNSEASEDVPCTPQMQIRKRLRSDTSTTAADASPIDPVVDPESSLQRVEISRLSSETPNRDVNTPITLSVAGPVNTVHTRDRRKRQRGESQSPVDDTPESSTVSVADPVGTVKPRDRRKRPRSESHSPVANIPEMEPNIASVADPVGTVKIRDRRKRPTNESLSPIADIPEVEAITVSVPDPVGTVKPRDRRKKPRKESTVADIPVVEPITVSVADPVSTAKTRHRRKKLENESRSPVPDAPLVEPNVRTAYIFRTSDCHVGASPDGTEENAEAELGEELKGDDIVMKRDDLDLEVNQSCKDKIVVKGRARKKRNKISRNYFQRGKKKSSLKISQEKVPPRSDRSTGILKILIDESKIETDESQVVEETTEPVEEKVDKSTKSTKRNIPKFDAPSLEVPESSSEDSDIKKSRRTKKSIVPPPLPSPRVADKSQVTEAFGLKRSRHGRLLVPPLATWRSQSIKYDTDGGIIAISDGFAGSEDENCTGYYNFKPPEDKGARTMRRRLCKAAAKGSRKR